jgi:hypothetical protein
MTSKSRQGAGVALEVVMSWGGVPQREDVFLAPARLTVGDEGDATFALPPEVCGRGFALAEPDGSGAWVIGVPAGASVRAELDEPSGPRALAPDALPADTSGTRRLRLPLGARAALTLGDFEFFLRPTLPEERVAPPAPPKLSEYKWVFASLGVHAAFLSTLLFMPPHAGALSLSLDDPQSRLVRYVVETNEVRPPPAESLDAQSGEASHGTQGASATGEEGRAGAPDDRRHTGGGVRVRGPSEDPRVPLTRSEAAQAGILGVLRTSQIFTQVTSPFGAAEARGAASDDAYGELWALTAGFSEGTGGLGMRGTGRGGCPAGQVCDAAGTVGVGSLGTIGTGGTCSPARYRELERTRGAEAARSECSGTGEYGRTTGLFARRPHVVPPRPGHVEVLPGGLGKEQIRRTIQRHVNEVRHCYERALQSNPSLSGRVTVQFLIAPTGAVQSAVPVAGRSDLGSADATACVASAVQRWDFPQAAAPTMVTYPFVFGLAGE